MCSGMPAETTAPAKPSFREALAAWWKIGLLSFGGPTGQIALMHTELVERRRWVTESRFLHALNYCMLLPGPEAQQLSVYIGWLLHGRWGGIVAGTLFVLPGAVLLWALSWLAVAHGSVPWVAAVFHGLKAAVLGLVLHAVLRIGAKALKNAVMWSIAGAAFVAIYFLGAPFPLIIALAGLIGLAGGRWRPELFPAGKGHGAEKTAIDDGVTTAAPAPTTTLRTALGWAALWLAPVAICWLLLGRGHVLTQEGLFFSKAAVVTFGGAYAVLHLIAQQAVETHGWLTAPQIIDVLGLAETTPGPLILVLQYVGFLGAWNSPTPFGPLAAATLGALMTLWCTFVPSFLFIFTGAPYIEALRGAKILGCALATITAAVVGVVLNLAVWFALGVLWPQGGGLDWFTVAVALGSFVGLQWGRWNVVLVVLGAAALGWLASLIP
ncbi:MAG: chromate transporter [Verrucomicrobiota bacterium]|nr:chromate transporter [Verrucomicrobiota bacterium]